MGSKGKAFRKVVYDALEDDLNPPASEHLHKVGSSMANAHEDGFAAAFEHLEKFSSMNGGVTYTENFALASEHVEKHTQLFSNGSEMGSPLAFEHASKFSDAVEYVRDSAAMCVDSDGMAAELVSTTEHLPGMSSSTASDAFVEGISHLGNTTCNGISATARDEKESSLSSGLITVFAEMGGAGKKAIHASLSWTYDKLHSVIASAYGFGAEIGSTYLVPGNAVNSTMTLGAAGVTSLASFQLVSRVHGG